MATIFVTGGAGFIGSNFVRYWLSTYPDDRLVNYDLLTYAGNLDSLCDVEETYADRYTFVQGDIGNYQLARHLFESHQPDWVVNFAAESHNSRAVPQPEIFFQTNVLGTQQLLQAALDAGRAALPPYLHLRSVRRPAARFGRALYGRVALPPAHPYNASKAAADLAVRAYHETFGLPTTISNCSNNYGPYQFPEKLIPHFIIRLMNGQKMPLYQLAATTGANGCMCSITAGRLT